MACRQSNAALLSIGPSETNFSEIRIEIKHFSFQKMRLKQSSAKLRPFCPGEDELRQNVFMFFENSAGEGLIYIILMR